MFSMAVLLAGPIVLTLMIIDFSSAILTRNMPQVNTYFLTLPIKITLGLFMFSLLMNDINPFMQKVFQAYFQLMTEVMS